MEKLNRNGAAAHSGGYIAGVKSRTRLVKKVLNKGGASGSDDGAIDREEVMLGPLDKRAFDQELREINRTMKNGASSFTGNDHATKEGAGTPRMLLTGESEDSTDVGDISTDIPNPSAEAPRRSTNEGVTNPPGETDESNINKGKKSQTSYLASFTPFPDPTVEEKHPMLLETRGYPTVEENHPMLLETGGSRGSRENHPLPLTISTLEGQRRRRDNDRGHYYTQGHSNSISFLQRYGHYRKRQQVQRQVQRQVEYSGSGSTGSGSMTTSCPTEKHSFRAQPNLAKSQSLQYSKFQNERNDSKYWMVVYC
jgi:hypothetical protein